MDNNCVYYCIYGDDIEYQKILTISLKSLNKFFDKDNIIVFSENNIEEIQGFAKIIKTDFPNGYAIPMAYRLILGKKLINEYNYDNIIHLDVDTVVIDNIDDVFDKFEDNKISFASESPTNKDKITNECWAGPLLNSEDLVKYQDVPSICCGVFGFNTTISSQLENIYNNVVEKEKKGFRGICKDQHAFTEYTLKNNLYNYNLQDYVDHAAGRFKNQDFINSDKLTKIYHFSGGVTSHNKYGVMEKFCSMIGI